MSLTSGMDDSEKRKKKNLFPLEFKPEFARYLAQPLNQLRLNRLLTRP
jgi:hypothetical protein